MNRARWLVASAAAALLVTIAAVALPSALPAPWSLAVAWGAFGVGAVLVLRVPSRAAVPLVVLGGLVLPLAAAAGPPRSSDDVYRYGWDARVQAAGIDPYRYPPAAPQLAGLRDPGLWPTTSNWCVSPGSVDPATGAALQPGCTLINRPAVHTIYPPVAQAAFLVAYALAPRRGLYRPYQLLAATLAFATTVLLVVAMRRAGADPRRAVLWAWCPTVAVEAANNAHVDVLAALLTAAGLLVLARAATTGRALGAGALFGLAVATKLTPALVLPAVVRRRPVMVLSGVAGAIALVYLPHLLAVGAGVLGYVPGYLQEEGYADGQRFAVLTLLVRPDRASAVAVGILAAVAIAVAWRAEGARPWLGATTMVGTALVVASPNYPWYALLLVVLVALGGRAWWLAVAAAGYLAQYGHDVGLRDAYGQRWGYGLALAAVLAIAGLAWARRDGALARTRLRRRPVDGA